MGRRHLVRQVALGRNSALCRKGQVRHLLASIQPPGWVARKGRREGPPEGSPGNGSKNCRYHYVFRPKRRNSPQNRGPPVAGPAFRRLPKTTRAARCSHCAGLTAPASLRRPHCAGLTAPASLRRPHCAGLTAPASVRRPHCAGLTAPASVRRPHSSGAAHQVPGTPAAANGARLCRLYERGMLLDNRIMRFISVRREPAYENTY